MKLQTGFNPGDIVTIHIPCESREWGYNPCPDGQRAVVINDYNSCWVNLILLDAMSGKYHREFRLRLKVLVPSAVIIGN